MDIPSDAEEVNLLVHPRALKRTLYPSMTEQQRVSRPVDSLTHEKGTPQEARDWLGHGR
jgi:hypothetical protein